MSVTKRRVNTRNMKASPVSRDGIWERACTLCSWAIKKYIVNNNKTDNALSSALIQS